MQVFLGMSDLFSERLKNPWAILPVGLGIAGGRHSAVVAAVVEVGPQQNNRSSRDQCLKTEVKC